MSSDTIDRLPTRASVQLSETGRGGLHHRQKDTRPSETKQEAQGEIKAVAAA